MVELLSPVGDFECLKAAVQNGADSVYFGADLFSARAFATNFSLTDLQKAINYAKIRGVKTNLTLNTLIKDNEYQAAIKLAEKAYEYGIDAIIVQDLGLAMDLIKRFPDLAIHGSTQMSIHNLQGALELEKLGFKRVVLSRELSKSEIEYICKNTHIEIECFIHGALCISYSGQCLFSSMLGGRSGNRGKCAGPCRLPFELLENNQKIDNGYLLSTRDLCGLDYIPFLIQAGVTCFKIEGRMKSPEYVATVTKIYRKYIDMALSNNSYQIDKEDITCLMQVFNRGMFSSGHLENKPNRNLVFKEKPNNMGIFLGIVQNYNKNKGHITLKLKESIDVGDTISIDGVDGTYTISEVMKNNQNIKETQKGQIITIGRMKGNIVLGSKIYKMASKSLTNQSLESYKTEKRKVLLNCSVSIKQNKPISIRIQSANCLPQYKGLDIYYTSNTIPIEAKTKPLDKQSVINQINKTTSTPYQFKTIDVVLDDNIFLPKLSSLNELRRIALEKVETFALKNINRNIKYITYNDETDVDNSYKRISFSHKLISVLLNILNLEEDYSKLENIDNIYIPLKYFTNMKYKNIIKKLNNKFNIYVYMPTIIKANYRNLFTNNIAHSILQYNIKGFVISNISNIELLKDIIQDESHCFELVSNYTFNVFNKHTVMELKKLGINKFTISPELDKETISSLCENQSLPKELIVYGKIPLLNMNYCLLGQTNKCYPDCKAKCKNSNTYFLRDRLNMKFDIIPDNIQTVTTIYNSKILSISPKDFNTQSVRIDILNETVKEINNIIQTAKQEKRLEGKEYTNGNLNRAI